MERLDGLGASELRDTLLHARAQEKPVSADEVATAFGVHRNVARSRLERLVAAGLLEPAFERRTGRQGPGAGRPAKVYAVAPELKPIEFPARHGEELVSLLAAALPDSSRADMLEDVGVRFGEQLAANAPVHAADDVPAALDALCCGLRRLGYQASVVEADADGGTLATPTCPLRPLMVSDPATHPLDKGMWRGLATAALAGHADFDVECSASQCGDEHASCQVHLRFHRSEKGVHA
jgi:predicted ArsR family transcriptional regulator